MKKIISWLLCMIMAVQVLQPCVQLKADEDTSGSSTSIDLLDVGGVSSSELDAFEKFELELKSSGTQNKLTCNVKLKDSYLDQYTYSEETAPTISAEIKIDGSKLKITDITDALDNSNTSNIYDSQNDVVATLKLSKTDSIITAKITFDPSVYESSNVSIEADLGVSVSEETTPPTTISNVYWNDTELLVSVDTTQTEVSPSPSAESTFTITKTAPNSVSTPYIDYTIHVTSTGETLEGKTISDVIPEGLKVDYIKLGSEVQTNIPLSEDGSTLLYEIPDTITDTNDVTITVRMMYDAGSSSDSESAANSNAVSQTFKNTAQLLLGDNREPVSSDETSTDMNYSRLTKEGVIDSEDHSLNKWELTVKGNYEGVEENTFIIDYINVSGHEYNEESKVKITAGSASATLDLEQITPSTPYSYQELYPYYCQLLSNDSEKCVYYNYTKGSESYQVMIIPYELIKSELNTTSDNLATMKVDYVTKRSTGTTSNASSGEMNNHATIVWTPNGVDPGNDVRTADIPKTITTGMVAKKAEKYDYEKQIRPWTLSINNYQVDVDNFVITEKFYNSSDCAVVFDVDENGDNYLTAEHYTRENSTSEIPSDPDEIWYFTEDDDGVLEKGEYKATYKSDGIAISTLEICFGDITASDYFEMVINTKIMEGSLFADSAMHYLTNTLTYDFDGKTDNDYTQVSADSVFDYGLHIKKTADNQTVKDASGNKSEQEYNYVNHTLKWSTTVNPYYLPINNAQLTDTLPDGSVFSSIESVSRLSVDGTPESPTSITGGEKSGTIKFADELEITYETDQSGQIVFKFNKEIVDQFVITYYTEFTDNYRLMSLANKDTAVEVVNNVTLSGTIYGVAMTNQTASATHNVTSTVLEKSGSYNSQTGAVAWSILINKEACDLTGMTVVDDLASLSNFKLSNDSMKLYEVTLASNGDVKDKKDISDILAASLVQGDNEFKFTFPASLKNKVLMLDFAMYVAGDVNKEEVINKVSLYDTSKSKLIETTATPDNMENVTYSQIASRLKKPILNIDKVSEEDDSLLSGAVFQITAMKNESGNWTSDPSILDISKTTDANGAIRLIMSNDTLYQIVETQAPAGYELNDTPVYVAFLSQTGSSDDYPTGTKIVEYSGLVQAQTTITFVDLLKETETPATTETPASEAPATTEVPATSETPSVVIPPTETVQVPYTTPTTETTETRRALTIMKDSEDGKKDGFTFLITGKSDGSVIYRNSFVTNANGLISLTGLLPGTYTIQEMSTDATTSYVIPVSQTVILSSTDVTVEFYNQKQKAVTPSSSPSPSVATPKVTDPSYVVATDGDYDSNGEGDGYAQGTVPPAVYTEEPDGTSPAPTESVNTSSSSCVPKTGDNSIPTVWLYVAMILSGGMFILLGVMEGRKKTQKKKKH